ncbi:MAG: hypothetical protein HYS86_04710 [Candidatus Chisholmbacteria bacterium]|nr:hypothetical protein [Candidatus Chisholmbacteria bacterium]
MTSKTAILRTLAYADIFSYPLTQKEFHHWLINRKKASVSSVNSAVSVLLKKPAKIARVGHYYTLKGRTYFVNLRHHRGSWSRPKLIEAKRVGEWLKIIPTITMVAVTGALSMGNTDKDDDIDLLIVTTPNTLWLTRLLVVPLISLIAKRRTPSTSYKSLDPEQAKRVEGLKDKSFNNAICLNLWLDETALMIPKKNQNLYTAHEVAQVKPLWSRPARRSPEQSRKGEGGREVKNKLLIHNRWVKQFLANIKILSKPTKEKSTKPSSVVNIVNQFAFLIQHLYMKRRITREKVTLHAAFFHPKNTKSEVMKQYHFRLRQLNIKP